MLLTKIALSLKVLRFLVLCDIRNVVTILNVITVLFCFIHWCIHLFIHLWCVDSCVSFTICFSVASLTIAAWFLKCPCSDPEIWCEKDRHQMNTTKREQCQKLVSRAGTSNYIPQYLWDVITCPCPWFWGSACQKQLSRAGTSKFQPTDTVGYSYLSLFLILRKHVSRAGTSNYIPGTVIAPHSICGM